MNASWYWEYGHACMSVFQWRVTCFSYKQVNVFGERVLVIRYW